MHFMIRLFSIFTTLLLFISCDQKKSHSYTFYYWKAKLSLSTQEKNEIEKTSTPLLYTRYFDIDKIDNKFQPLGVITHNETFSLKNKIAPTVFITNRSFINITDHEITFLANQTHQLIIKKSKDYKLNTNEEIQIDCDWTAGTRDDYFKFLNELKTISGKNITSTLRLHQVKDKDIMGIPPVSAVFLMCYSTSSPLEYSTKNSILDVTTLKNYLSKLEEYPIKEIHVALPIYSWGIVTNHLGKHKLINGLSKKDLQNPNFRLISENEIEITKEGYYFGNLLNRGFKIKVEEISNEQINEVVKFLDSKINDFPIIYYQLDEPFLKGRNFNLY